jgi:hypothetical protein
MVLAGGRPHALSAWAAVALTDSPGLVWLLCWARLPAVKVGRGTGVEEGRFKGDSGMRSSEVTWKLSSSPSPWTGPGLWSSWIVARFLRLEAGETEEPWTVFLACGRGRAPAALAGVGSVVAWMSWS